MKILDYILCEDIRAEVGSKFSLIGTFNDQIVIQQKGDKAVKWPIVMRLAIYLKILLDESENYDSLNIVFSEESTGIEYLNVNTNIVNRPIKSTPLLIHFVLPGFKISSPTELHLKIDGICNKEIVSTLKPFLQYKVCVKEEGKELS